VSKIINGGVYKAYIIYWNLTIFIYIN
jgi:hypothetical protein